MKIAKTNPVTALLCAILAAGTLTTVGCMSRAGPAETAATQPLVNTHWRLTMLGDEVVENPPGERDVHITLQEKNQIVTGNSGCNRMFGHYAVNGDAIKFDQMGGTKMFCDARMDLERKFLAMFDAVARWKIAANTLQLLDASGKSVGTFETT